MAVRFHRSPFWAALLVLAAVYGYFSTAGRRVSPQYLPASPISLSGSSSIQGPYFSDQNRVSDRIVAAINNTRQTLDIAVYSITQPDITTAIEAAHVRGVRIRIVSDEEQSFDRHSEIDYLRSRGIPVRLSGGFRGKRSLMHDKFAIFDRNLVETGSFNWTTSGTSYNFENIVFIESPAVAKRFSEEFEHIWASAR